MNEVVVILSTHIVDDVADLCRNMAIMNKGSIQVCGDPRALLEPMVGNCWTRPINRGELSHFRQRYDVISTRLVLGRLHVNLYSENASGCLFPANGTGFGNPVFPHLKSGLNAKEAPMFWHVFSI